VKFHVLSPFTRLIRPIGDIIPLTYAHPAIRPSL
jgi:hypothetical protein